MVRAAEEYLESRVMTAPPERLHLLVVEAALRFARVGAEALREQKYDRSFAALSKARECVSELICGVRADVQPELSVQLKQLFMFCHKNLLQGDLEHSPAHVDDAIRVLAIHRETWLELLNRLAAAKTDSVAAPDVAQTTVEGSRRLDQREGLNRPNARSSAVDEYDRPGLDLTS